MKKKKSVFVFLLMCIIIYSLTGIVESCTSDDKKDQNNSYLPDEPNRYIKSNACMSCHPDAYKDWKQSDHYLAMLPANDSTVFGDFNNSTFSADGVKYKFFRDLDKFYIQTTDIDGSTSEYEVLYTFGHFPLQQYLIEFPGGRMQATRVSWDSRENKWFHQYQGNEINPDDWLHWTENGQNWNTMCASCHSTNLKKEYNFEKDSYHTTWSEINVGCESCHGQGNSHIKYMQSLNYSNGDTLLNMGFAYGKGGTPEIQLNTCTHCHSRKAVIDETPIESDEIMDNMIPQIITTEYYFADGQIREEDYVYGSFVQSKMYHNDVKCSDCHNPHSGKLKLLGNTLCMTCHEPEYDTPSHHFHEMETNGSQCVNCHMTSRVYMGNDHRRDHSFRVPRPDQSVLYNTPNACTGCHEDKTDNWAASAVQTWYGSDRSYHFSDDLIPGSELNENSQNHLIKLLKDTSQPEIARATSAHYLGSILTLTTANALIDALGDKNPLVRYHALRSLSDFPPYIWVEKAGSALTDKVRAVRLSAASLYRQLPEEAIPVNLIEAYNAADLENQKYLEHQTDFAIGNVMLADYKLMGNEEQEAIKYYIRGLKKDNLMNYARLNLATAYSMTNNPDKALQTLNEAAAIDQTNDQIFYNLALLHNELGNSEQALANFQLSDNLSPLNIQFYYNYGLFLLNLGEIKKAESTLLKGYQLGKSHEAINYVLMYFYVQQNKPQMAVKYARTLYAINPGNPDYQAYFSNLKIGSSSN